MLKSIFICMDLDGTASAEALEVEEAATQEG
jgi:hypothetical protein